MNATLCVEASSLVDRDLAGASASAYNVAPPRLVQQTPRQSTLSIII